MLLAEALTQRVALGKAISDIFSRVSDNVFTEEGVAPEEDAATLLDEALGMQQDLYNLINRINAANNQTVLDTVLGDLTISQAVVERERLDKQIQQLQGILRTATNAPNDRNFYGGNEERIKYTRHLDPKNVRAKIKELTTTRQTLDSQLQQANWTTQL